MFTRTHKAKILRTHETAWESQRWTETQSTNRQKAWEPRDGVTPQHWLAVTVAKVLSYIPAVFTVQLIANHTATHHSRCSKRLKHVPKTVHKGWVRYPPHSQLVPSQSVKAWCFWAFFHSVILTTTPKTDHFTHVCVVGLPGHWCRPVLSKTGGFITIIDS